MKFVIALIAAFAFAGVASAISFESVSFMWDAWKVQNSKIYVAEEEVLRFSIFADNVAKIEKFNAENDLTKLGINKFADLTAQEFKTRQAGCAKFESNAELVRQNTLKLEEVGNLPTSFDWRSKGALTPVKNQGQCGSCWTFSTTGLLEGFNFVNKKKLVSFSEQQIVDCDKDTNQGCEGGWPYLAVQYAAENGLETESTYPYTGEDGTCRYKKGKATVVNKNYTFVTANSTEQLKTALINNPISVLIEADEQVFQFYTSGVIWRKCGNQLDHAVLAVGWQKVAGIESFIVKNSWGADWGQSGYVYISTNQKANEGTGVCGILAQPVTATH